MKVLLLENDFAVAQMLAATIRAKGWEVFFATDSEYALPVAQKVHPDAIILNCELNGSAMVALQGLRASVHTAKVPVILVSNPAAEETQALLAAGAQQSFAPSANPDQVVSAIEAQLAKPLHVEQAPEEIISSPERMSALEKTGLLDSGPEECFDSLTELAAKLLGAPTALMSLVDKDRQFFKSQFGLGEPWSSECQTPLSHSFCQWVVSEQEELIVDDAREHPVLCNNGAVHDLGVVAYVGVPLAIDAEHTIGSFCTLDSRPHAWTDLDLATLDDLAKIISAFIVVQMVRDTENPAPVDITPSKLVQAASGAILGASNILHRDGGRLGEPERAQLSELVSEWSSELRVFAEV